MRFLSILAVLLILSGCSMIQGRIKGGNLSHSALTGSKTDLTQSNDPKDASKINSESELSKHILIPAGSIITFDDVVNSKDVTNSPKTSILVSSNTFMDINIKDKTESSIGAANKNLFQETAAKLSSMKYVSWIGILVFLFGILSMFYPPVKLIINSVTTSMAFIVGGLLLIILPVVIVGHELLILGGIGGGVGIWFLAHRYASHATKATVYKDFIDLNNNKIDDRLEEKK